MRPYKTRIAALLLCILMLAGCGKAAESAKNDAAGTQQSTNTAKPEASAKPDAMAKPGAPASPAVSPVATSTPNAATPTPTPEQDDENTAPEAEDPAQDAASIPKGNWVDHTTGMSLSIDDAGNVTVLWKQSDGTAYCWICTVARDDAGVLRYSDCTKLSQTGDSASSTLYQNGTGTLTVKNGNLYWQDDIENIAANLVFEAEG